MAYDTDFAMFYTLYHIFKQESIQGIHYIIYFNHAFDNTCILWKFWIFWGIWNFFWNYFLKFLKILKFVTMFYTLYHIFKQESIQGRGMIKGRPNNLSLVCLYLSLYISFLLFGHFFLTHWDRKHYYIKVVESIQFVCTGNTGISRVLCNANTYQSIHEGLFFNSSTALDLKYPSRLPYIHFYFSSLHLHYKMNISTNQIDSYILVVGEADARQLRP
jgi:hypothetical protein